MNAPRHPTVDTNMAATNGFTIAPRQAPANSSPSAAPLRWQNTRLMLRAKGTTLAPKLAAYVARNSTANPIREVGRTPSNTRQTTSAPSAHRTSTRTGNLSDAHPVSGMSTGVSNVAMVRML